jgi:hypothetical protein
MRQRPTKQHGGILYMRAEFSKGYWRGWVPVYDTSVATHAHPCALLGEGRTRREAGAQSPGASFLWEAAGLPNRAGSNKEFRPHREGGRMRPSSSEVFHAGLALHSSCLLLGGACGRCGL